MKNLPKISLHHPFGIQQWLALNCKPKRSLNQCHFTSTHKQRTRTHTVTVVQFVFCRWKLAECKQNAYILNAHCGQPMIPSEAHWCCCFLSVWSSRALLPNRLPHTILPTNTEQKVSKELPTNINYISAAAQEINYAFSMEIYYFIIAQCTKHRCADVTMCSCMKMVLKCRQFELLHCSLWKLVFIS